MRHSSTTASLLLSALALSGCLGDPEEVVENEDVVELEPLGGMPTDGPPVFEIVAQAQIDPPYDAGAEGEPLAISVVLFHCGAHAYAAEDEVRVPEGTVDIAEVGGVLIVDYDDFGDQELRLGGAGPYNVSVIYDIDGVAIYSESDEWNGSGGDLAVVPRALDVGTPLFRVDPLAETPITLLDPSADYDAATQTLTTRYTFGTQSGQQHSITETYRFGGRHLPSVQSAAWACD